MVGVARGAGFHDQVGIAAQALAHQVQVHRAGGEQGMHGGMAVARAAVAEDQQLHALAHRRLGLGADARQRAAQPGAPVEVQVDVAMPRGEALQRQQLVQLALRQYRRVEHHVVDVLGLVQEQVALAPDLGGERHHALLAQRIDGRVGDLGEGLAEAVVQRTHALADRRHRHVVAHRADAFLLGLGERAQHRFLLLARELEQLLEGQQHFRGERRIGQRRVDQLGVQPAHAALEPLLVRGARPVDGVDRVVVEQASAVQVHGDHLARPELALGPHPFGREVPNAGFRGDHEHAVGRERPARRAQAVAVERAGGETPVAHHHAGRPVPGFGIDRVVLVEGREVGILVFQRLGGRRDQDAHRLRQFHAAQQQPLEHVVQRLRIRAVHGHGRLELRDVQQR